jgi:histidinol-phosphate phosphatase family protein
MRWPDPASDPRLSAGERAAPSPALLLDRDGVLIADRDYLADPEGVEVLPGVPAALRRAREAGYLLIGVSNQSGLGRGRFDAEQFARVMRRFLGDLRRAGAPLDAFFYCPHAPGAACRCRKPSPGLLEEARAELPLDLGRSWVIGDKVSDVDLALDHGLHAALVRTGHGCEQATRLGDRQGVLIADDLPAAVGAILAEDAR